MVWIPQGPLSGTALWDTEKSCVSEETCVGVHLSLETYRDWFWVLLHRTDLAWDQEALATSASSPATSASAPVLRSSLHALYTRAWLNIRLHA